MQEAHAAWKYSDLFGLVSAKRAKAGHIKQIGVFFTIGIVIQLYPPVDIPGVTAVVKGAWSHHRSAGSKAKWANQSKRSLVGDDYAWSVLLDDSWLMVNQRSMMGKDGRISPCATFQNCQGMKQNLLQTGGTCLATFHLQPAEGASKNKLSCTWARNNMCGDWPSINNHNHPGRVS